MAATYFKVYIPAYLGVADHETADGSERADLLELYVEAFDFFGESSSGTRES